MHSSFRTYYELNDKNFDGNITGNYYLDRAIDAGAYIQNTILSVSSGLVSTFFLVNILDNGLNAINFVSLL